MSEDTKIKMLEVAKILFLNKVSIEESKYIGSFIEEQNAEMQKLNDRIDNAINFIDQVLMYHLQDYKQLDEDCNTLIGILKGNDKK